MSFFPPIMHGPTSGRSNGGVLLCRLAEFVRHLGNSTFHRAALRVSDDPASAILDYVTVLQQSPTCVVLYDFDMTLAEIDPNRLHAIE